MSGVKSPINDKTLEYVAASYRLSKATSPYQFVHLIFVLLRGLSRTNRNSTLHSPLFLMAPAISTNSFPIATGLHSKPDSRRTRANVTVFAKQNFLRIGKPKDAESSEADEEPKKQNRFFVDFGKIPDAKSLIPMVVSNPSTKSLFGGGGRKKDPKTVFVAGATGQAGSRITQSLLQQGFNVRAGVSDLAAAQELARLASTYKLISPAESKRLNAVESTFDDPESIAKSIGPATKLVITIGPTEDGPTDPITTNDALNVILAAQLSAVSHVAVIYDSSLSRSTNNNNNNNVITNFTSFFNNIFNNSSKSLSVQEFLTKVVETTDVKYTLIKAAIAEDGEVEGGSGLVVEKEGSAVGGKANEVSLVSRSQIAKLVADVFSNTSVAENKVVEVSTSPSATTKSLVELFSTIPEDGRRKAYQEAIAKAKAKEEAIIASERAREAAEAASKLQEEVKKLSEQETKAAYFSKEARAKAAEAGSTLDNILTKAKDFGGGEFSWDKLSSQFANAVSPNSDEKPKAQIATIRGQAKARNLPAQKAVIKQPAKSKPKQTESKPKTETRNVFGGLFKQETIYMDD